MFPLFKYEGGLFETRTSNFNIGCYRKFVNPSDCREAAEVIFFYIYAILFSQAYRKRYGDALRDCYPHIPFTDNSDLFDILMKLGNELVKLHLLNSDLLNNPITFFTGQVSTKVEKVTYLNNTIWFDKAQSCGFFGVPKPVWDFHIGGYQVCHKWLKDRNGRVLSSEDIEQYQRIVVAINETIRIMDEIDVVIDEHGGWPDAFST